MRTKKINTEHLKMLIVDEADHVMDSERNNDTLQKMIQILNGLPSIQLLFFSATFSEQIIKQISNICK